MRKAEALQRLLRPASVAFIGGDSAAEALRQCQAIGFDGELWAINPQRDSLGGLRCRASLDELPAAPDASFVAAPPAASLELIEQLAAKGAPGAVCFAAGFAETGADGARLQADLQRAAGDMAVIGPNCHGFVNYLDGVALWPDKHGGRRVATGVALVSQSGNIAINLSMQQRGLDIAYVLSVGNNGVLGLHDYIDALLGDERVTAIGLHIEGIDDVAAFAAASIRALVQGVPVVALKSGRSTQGADITRSHTASLAAPDRLYDALFRRLGIARCETLAQFLETLKLVSIGRLPRSTDIGSLSCSGGDAALVADAAERLGMATPALQPAAAARLGALLGPRVHISNPLDYHLYVWGDYEMLKACFCEMLRQGFGYTLLVLDYPLVEGAEIDNWLVAERALTDAIAATGQPALVVASLPETMPAAVRERLKQAGIAPMQGIDDCLFAIRAAAGIASAQGRGCSTAAPPATRPMSSAAVRSDEWQTKATLREIGVATPEGSLCSRATAPAAAAQLGYPVVLKAVDDDLAHKTEQKAVATGIRDEAALRTALDAMPKRFSRFLVEQEVSGAVAEIIVGVSHDPVFGLTLLVGSGGTLVELLDDTVSLLLPVQRDEIEAALRSLRCSAILDGYRGGPAADLAALLDAIERIGQYAEARQGSLLELDINPLLVLQDGAVAVDAKMRSVAQQ